MMNNSNTKSKTSVGIDVIQKTYTCNPTVAFISSVKMCIKYSDI